MKSAIVSFFIVICLIPAANAGFFDDLKSMLGDKDEKTSSTLASAVLSNEEVAEGLREALGKGAQYAVDELGREDGFLSNVNVKIPIPEKFEKIEKGLRAIGKDKLADDFEMSMNRAAEQAVPMAADVFREAISNMTIEDAMAVLKGGDTAGTDFLRKTSSDSLREQFRPIVEKAIQQVDVTRSYQEFVGGNSLVGSLLGKNKSLNLNDYVTDEALDGVFYMVAQEEKKIRENPAARTTELLKKVFGRKD